MMNNTYRLTEGAILLAIFSVLLLITLYIPVLGLVVNLFLSLPFLFFGAKHDWKSTAVFTVGAILLSLILGSLLAIPLALAYGTTGAVMGGLIREGKSRLAITAAGAFVFLINLIAIYGISVAFFNANIVQEMLDLMRSSFVESQQMLKSMGQATDEKVIKQFETMMDLMETIIPSILVVASFFTVFITQLVSFPILKRFGIKFPDWRPFRELILPKSILWYYLFSMLASLLMPPDEGTYWFMVIANLAFILQILMVMQGLALLFYITHVKGYPRAMPITVMVLLLFFPFVLSIVRILGIIDLGFDLRKRLGEK
jgi:uncharacterized protein YybS (DUF2232 family)